MFVHVYEEPDKYIAFTGYSGFIPSEEILRINNEMYGFVVPSFYERSDCEGYFPLDNGGMKEAGR